MKQLDAFMHDFYKSNAGKMSEGLSGTRVERQPKKKVAPAAPPPNP